MCPTALASWRPTASSSAAMVNHIRPRHHRIPEPSRARVVAADRILERGYGKPHQAEAPSDPRTIEGIVIEPLRKSDGNGSAGPVRLEDWRKDP